MQQRDLTHAPDCELYSALDTAERLRSREGRGRGPKANQVRTWCNRQKTHIRREPHRRGLPTSQPDRRWAAVGRGILAGRTSSAALQRG